MKFAENKAINLLLIEDNNEQALIITLILENNNCKVKIINEGQKALDYIKSQKELPELIFLDYYLPDMTGIDLLKQIAHYNSGIVFLTSINDTEIALEAIRLGAIDFITKSEHLTETLPIAVQKAYTIYNERLKKTELEHQVVEKEEIFFKTISLAPWGMHFYIMNEEDQLIFIGANPSADDILGISHNTLIDKTIEEAFPTLSGSEIAAEYKNIALKGGSWHKEQITYKDRKIEGVFDVTAYQPSYRQVVAIFRDITDKHRHDSQIKLKNAEIELKNEEIQKQFTEYIELIEELSKTNKELSDTKEKAQESERNYHEIYDSTSDAIIIHDSVTGKIVDVNKTTLWMFGYEDKEDIISNGIKGLSMSDDGYTEEKGLEMIQKTKKTEPHIFEWYARKKNDKAFWVEISLKKTKISGVERIMASIRDITKRKKAEEALRNSQEMLQNVMGHFPDMVFWKDLDSVYIGCNQSFANAAGFYKPSEIVGKTDYDLPWGNTEADTYREEDQQVITNNEAMLRIINPQHQADGKMVWLETNKIPLCDDNGNVIGVMGTSTNITERKKAEDALAEERKIFITGPTVVFKWSLQEDGPVEYVSPNVREVLGYPMQDIISGIPYISIIHPEDLSRFREEVKIYLENKISSFTQEYRIIKKDGNIIDVIDHTSVNYNRKGKAINMYGYILDITDRKQYEMQLKIKNEEIELKNHEIRSQNEEMRAQNDELTKNLKKINSLNKVINDREKILQSLINTADIGITIINKEGKFELYNKYMHDNLGYKENELNQLTLFSLAHPDDKTKTKEYIKSLFQSSSENHHFEERILRSDKTFFWAEIMLSAIKDDEGKTEMVVGVIRDISKRKEFENLLKKNELQFRSIWENSFDGMRLTDEKGTTVLVNDAYCRMVGMSKSQLEGYKYPIIYNTPNSKKQVDSFVERFKKREIEMHFDKKVTLWNNEVRWFDITNAYILEDINKPMLLSIFRDTTEQQLAKEASFEKQRQINTLISNLPGIVYRSRNDKKWTKEFIGGECRQLTGYDADDFIQNGKISFSDLIHPEYRMILWEKWQKTLAERTLFEYEFPITTADGEEKWVWERGRGIYSEEGDVIALEGFITDVTEKIRAAKKQLDAERKYRSIFESAHEGIFQSTVEGKFITANPAFAKMFGYDSPEEMLNSEYDITRRHYLNPGNREEFLRKMEKQSFLKGFEFQAKRKDGSVMWVYEDVRAVKDEKGKTLYFEGFCIDITKQKQTEELAIQKETAENTAKFKQQFLANMSHEMRTPMNGIMGMIGFLIKTKLDDTQLSYTKTIQESSDTLLNIINNILDLSRLEAGKITLHPKIVNIHDISRKTRQLFNALIKQKNISFKVNYADTTHEFIKADEYRVNQIIANFLSNSIKFTEKGCITINYKQSMKGNKVQMQIEITDTGIGINREHQKLIFNKFSQIDSSKTRHFDGAGLGLSICRELAVIMSGNVGFTSKQGKGSTFWFTFEADPVTENEIEQFNKTKNEAEQSSFGLNILIVEDKAVNAKILSMMLKNMGCSSEIAVNGKEALKIFKENKFDIILMDVQMPIMDGVTAANELKKSFTKIPPIIALTADAMEGDAEYYISQGMDDYLSKPILNEALYLKIQKWSGK